MPQMRLRSLAGVHTFKRPLQIDRIPMDEYYTDIRLSLATLVKGANLDGRMSALYDILDLKPHYLLHWLGNLLMLCYALFIVVLLKAECIWNQFYSGSLNTGSILFGRINGVQSFVFWIVAVGWPSLFVLCELMRGALNIRTRLFGSDKESVLGSIQMAHGQESARSCQQEINIQYEKQKGELEKSDRLAGFEVVDCYGGLDYTTIAVSTADDGDSDEKATAAGDSSPTFADRTWDIESQKPPPSFGDRVFNFCEYLTSNQPGICIMETNISGPGYQGTTIIRPSSMPAEFLVSMVFGSVCCWIIPLVIVAAAQRSECQNLLNLSSCDFAAGKAQGGFCGFLAAYD